MNVTVFFKRCPTINIYMKFNTEPNVGCRILHCVGEEKYKKMLHVHLSRSLYLNYNGHKQQYSDFVLLFYIAMHDQAI